MIYIPKDLCITLPDKVLQILPLLTREEQILFSEYYTPFTAVADSNPKISYHILSLLLENHAMKNFLLKKEAEK